MRILLFNRNNKTTIMSKVTELEDYVLEQIKDLPAEQAREILEEMAGDFKVMAENYND